MSTHIRVDAASGLVHSLVTFAANVHDVMQAYTLPLHISTLQFVANIMRV